MYEFCPFFFRIYNETISSQMLYAMQVRPNKDLIKNHAYLKLDVY